MEFDATVKGEAIDKTVIRDCPGLRQCRRHRSIGAIACQPFEDIGIDHLVNGRGGTPCRVEIGRLQLHADGDRGLRGKRCLCPHNRGRGKRKPGGCCSM